MVWIKVAVIVVFILAGLQFVDTANWHPYLPENTGTAGNEWLAKVQRAVLLDSEIDSLSGGRTAARRIPNGGARSVGTTNGQQEGRTSEVSINIHCSIAYPRLMRTPQSSTATTRSGFHWPVPRSISTTTAYVPKG